ncbi:3',5'-cyclic-nucleotide phosphodiesterase [Halomonas sp. LS-001]
MQIIPLGISGGLEQHQGTSAFLVSSTLLIDAGTGVQQLDAFALSRLRSIFITHAHIDHIASLPMLLDTQFETLAEHQQSLTVYALPEVITSLQTHIFNGAIWPNFSRLPSVDSPILRYEAIYPWQRLTLPDAHGQMLDIMPFPVTHSVPTCGFWVSDGHTRIAFSGDTGLSSTTIASLNQLGSLDCLVIECAFANYLDGLAEMSQHLTPQRLAHLLSALETAPKAVWITHLKPQQRTRIKQELHQLLPPTLNWTLTP